MPPKFRKQLLDLFILPIVFGILLFLLMFFVVPRSWLDFIPRIGYQGPSTSGSESSNLVGQITGESGITGAPSIDALFIDSVLCAAHSPACHTGEALYQAGVGAGIDPVFALAFFQHESNYGKKGIAVETRSLGNIRCTDGYPCIDGFRAYSSWEESYKDWYQLLLWYIGTLGKKTLRDILYTYAPPIENSTEGYIAAVCSAVNGWRALAGRGEL